MKRWIWAAILLLPLTASAQTPDNERMEPEINNPASPWFYPALMQRCLEGDPALGREEYRHLYYGYAFQPEYDPLTPFSEADSLVDLLLKPHPELEDFRAMIRLGTKMMEYDPFSPRNLNVLTYAYGMIGDVENEAKLARRFDGVMEAILSTGAGNEESSPWHILFFGHAEDVMDYLQLKYLKPMVVSRTTEYFPLIRREGGTRGYYFDYSRVYSRPPEESSRPRERRWQINDRLLK